MEEIERDNRLLLDKMARIMTAKREDTLAEFTPVRLLCEREFVCKFVFLRAYLISVFNDPYYYIILYHIMLYYIILYYIILSFLSVCVVPISSFRSFCAFSEAFLLFLSHFLFQLSCKNQGFRITKNHIPILDNYTSLQSTYPGNKKKMRSANSVVRPPAAIVVGCYVYLLLLLLTLSFLKLLQPSSLLMLSF